MLSLMWSLVGKVFVFVIAGAAIGYAAGDRGERVSKVFVAVALYVLIPLFVFFSMWMSPVSISASLRLILVALAVIAFGTLLARLWTRYKGISFRKHCLPIIFMNSAYLAIPVNTLIWGEAGAVYAIIFNLVVTVCHFTFGIWLVESDKPFSAMFSLPIIYAIFAGGVLNYFAIQPSKIILELQNIITLVSLPSMLLFVGYRISKARVLAVKKGFMGVALRMFGGLAFSLIAVKVLGLRGAEAGVAVVTSSMPAAVQSFILSEKYEGDVEFAASAVFYGTLLSVITIPVIIYFITYRN